jgi:SPX domain protein involved in polyphosphate accumulation
LDLQTDIQQSDSKKEAGGFSASETESFVRIEDKYLVSRTHLPKLLLLLNSQLDPSYISDDVLFNKIESLYFDSPALKVFRDHFKSGISRFKLRLRQYGPNGKFAPETEPVHLEMKQKADGVSQKFRFKVGLMAKLSLLAGETLPVDFAEAKKKKELIAERCLQVNSAISDFGLRPQVRVTYERLAFERNGLRVTIDDNIEAELLTPIEANVVSELLSSTELEKAKQMIAQYSPNVVIVEVKHPGTTPEWLNTFFADSQTTPASFSKYCYSIGQHIVKASAV